MMLLWEMQPDPDKEKMETFCEKSSLKMEERFTKTLYYGEMPDEDCPSLPLTDIAVDYLQGVTPRKLGRVDNIFASSVASRARASPCSVLMSMIYTKRLRNRNPEYLDQMSSSDLFLISMMMASKFIYDEGVEEEVFNDEWAEAADMELTELNQMERDFLQAIDWQLFVKRSEFFHLVNQVEQRIALQEGIGRGWFSYTDLMVLSRNPQFDQLWSQVASDWLQVVLVGSTAYMAGIMTLIASTILALQVSAALTLFGTVLLTPQSNAVGPMLPSTFDAVPFVSNSTPATEMETSNMGNFTEQEIDMTSIIQQSTESTPDDISENQPITILDSLMNKLFALITLKQSMVQFICAVAENWRSTHGKHSLRKTHLQQNKSIFFESSQAISGKCVCGLPISERSGLESGNRYSIGKEGDTCPSCLLASKSSRSSFCQNQKCPRLSHPSNCCSYSLNPSNHMQRSFCTMKGGHLGEESMNSWREYPCCLEEPPGSVDVGLVVDTSLSFTTKAHMPVQIHA